MTVTPALAAEGTTPESAAEIARVRASGVLGASGRLVELFDFLVTCSAEGRSPKEAEIAFAVFGKSDSEALRDDPVARVYIHRLRKRLDEYYLRNGMPDGVRLDIPKGDYRIVVAPASAPVAANDDETATPPMATAAPAGRALPWKTPDWKILAACLLVLLLGGNIAAWALLGGRNEPQSADLTKAPVWSALTASERPLTIVAGDYYMFGEYEDRVTLKRLIRDFGINNKEDLVQSQVGTRDGFEKYSDVALQYLPASTAYALADLAPLFGENRDVRVVLASDLAPERLKTDDIIYVGLLSGLGALRDPVFSQSHFQFGESYDQLIDRETGRNYVSEAFLSAPSDQMYRDYGFFASFAGPEGNRIAILSGSRDTAVMGVAEAMTQPDRLRKIERAIAGGAAGVGDFEALFEVKGQKHINLEAQVIASYALDSSAIWSGARARVASYPAK